MLYGLITRCREETGRKGPEKVRHRSSPPRLADSSEVPVEGLIFRRCTPRSCLTKTCIAVLQLAHAESPPLRNGTAESRLEHDRGGKAQSDKCVQGVRTMPEKASSHRNEVTLYIADLASGPAERASATAGTPAVSFLRPHHQGFRCFPKQIQRRLLTEDRDLQRPVICTMTSAPTRSIRMGGNRRLDTTSPPSKSGSRSSREC